MEKRSIAALAICGLTIFFFLLPLPFHLNAVGILTGLSYTAGLAKSGFSSTILGVAALLLLVAISAPLLRGGRCMPLVSVILLAAWSTMRSSSLGGAFEVATLLLFPVLLLVDRNGVRILKLLLQGMAFLNCSVALWLFWKGVGQFYTTGFGTRASGVYFSPNVQYLLAMFGLCSFMEEPSDTWAGRVWQVLGLAICGITLWLTNERSGLLGAAVAAVATVFLLTRSASARAAVLCISISLLVLGLASRTGGNLPHIGSDSSLVGRTKIWSNAWDSFIANPVVGYGYGAYAHMHVSSPHIRWPDEPKNLFLALAIDGGLIKLILFLVFALSAAWELWLVRKDRPEAATSLGALLALFVAGLFDTPGFEDLSRLPGTAMFLILLAIGLGPGSINPTQPRPDP